MFRLLFVMVFIAIGPRAFSQSASTVQYLANEGVMITHEETKVLFDPLFQNNYNQYQMVPDDMREAMFDGQRPFDGIDAVFISHYHGDHFSAADVLRLLRSQRGVRLYAPAQAVAGIRQLATDEDDPLFERIVGLDLEYGDSPVSIDADDLVIDAVHVPHAGWPTARTEVQNVAFRVTLGDNSTVLHLGDADARIVHFTADQDYWDERTIDLAFPPFWFFGSQDGIEVLENRLDIRHSIGIHVPASFEDSSNIPTELQGYDLFTRPGEGRRFFGTQ